MSAIDKAQHEALLQPMPAPDLDCQTDFDPSTERPRPANIIELQAVVIAEGIWFLDALGDDPHWTNSKNLLTARRFSLTAATAFVKRYSDLYGSRAMKTRVQPVV